jgi:Fe2+ or Zn2+ uptake regulation protein
MDSQTLIDAIGGRRYRITHPRRRVIASIAEKDTNFTAEELHAELNGVGRATVYRTIKLLVEQGLLCKISLPDGSPRYMLTMSGHHHHLVCVSCGLVSEFHESEIEQLLSEWEASGKGTVVGHRIEVYVVCTACQTRLGGPANFRTLFPHPVISDQEN